MMGFGYHSILGVLILAGDIWAIINIFQSSASNEKKLIWILVVAVLPVLGLILWYFLDPARVPEGPDSGRLPASPSLARSRAPPAAVRVEWGAS